MQSQSFVRGSRFDKERMSLYRRNLAEKKMQRWNPVTGTWVDCAFDEPETRPRKATEGMVILPWRFETNTIPIKDFIEAVRNGDIG